MLRQRKVPKRKATPSLRPLRGAKGQTCGVSVAGCAVELTALRCSFVQTSTASQSTKHGRCDAHATPQPPRRRRSQQGWDSRTSKQPNSRTSIRAIAALGPVCAARGACAREMGPSEAKARGDVWFPTPLWMRRGAQRAGWRVCRRTHALRDLTCRVCLNAAPQARSELRGTAPRPSTAGCPAAKHRGYGQQGRASFASFSCTRKKRKSPAGASPGPGKQTQKSAKTAPKPIPASASSSQKRSNQAFSEYPFGQPPGRSQHSSQPRSRAVWPIPGLKVLVGSSAR